MTRITVNISDDAEEWLESEADRLNWSKADAGGHCIAALHSTAGHIDPQQLTDDQSTAQNSTALKDRVADLEQRVAELERDESVTDTDSEPKPEPGPGTGLPTPDPEIVERVKALDWDEFDTNPTREKAETVAICYERLRNAEDGEIRTAEIRDSVYEERGHGISVESWWSNWVSLALRQLPGATSPPSGGQYWRYEPPE